jgi:hypothetical protein
MSRPGSAMNGNAWLFQKPDILSPKLLHKALQNYILIGYTKVEANSR